MESIFNGVSVTERLPTGNPCIPSPCGLNTLCEVMGGRAACSCLPDMAGDPQTGCHPECTLNSDCAPHMVCLNQHCVDPCAQGHICGLGAKCTCRDHTASCVCHEGFTGDPFIQCIPIREFSTYSLLVNIKAVSYLQLYLIIKFSQIWFV